MESLSVLLLVKDYIFSIFRVSFPVIAVIVTELRTTSVPMNTTNNETSSNNTTGVNSTKIAANDEAKMNNSLNKITIPAIVFDGISSDETGVFFSMYDSDILFPLRLNQSENENDTYKAIGSGIISASVAGKSVKGLTETVNISLSIIESVSPIIIFHVVVLHMN